MKACGKQPLHPTPLHSTPPYLVHVSICATSHPLNELKVMLRVPPLDLTTGPGKDIHDGVIQVSLYIYLALSNLVLV